MIDLANVAPEDLNQIFVLLQSEFKKRKWNAFIPYNHSPHCFIDRGDGKTLHIFSATPPTTSFAAAHLANDKFATHQVLEGAGILQLDTALINGNKIDHSKIAAMLGKYKILAVKPKDGGHGMGITLGCTTLEDVVQAISLAVEQNKSGVHVLVQEQYKQQNVHDIRIVCIDYKYVAALLRKPARVFGDGTSTIRQLVDKENGDAARGVAYRSRLASIDVGKVESYLGSKIQEIPGAGVEVPVLGIANYGAGGETVDITDDIPQWLRTQAQEASRVCELPVAGVDYMIGAFPKIAATTDELQAVLIEINKCPALAMHDIPTEGSSKGVVAQYVDYLANL